MSLGQQQTLLRRSRETAARGRHEVDSVLRVDWRSGSRAFRAGALGWGGGLQIRMRTANYDSGKMNYKH